PAVYEPGTTRANKNVIAWAGWCAVDVDDIEVDGELDAFVSKLVGSWRYVCYSTASSKIDKPKFRLVFELNRDLQQTEIKHFWFALQSHLDDRGDKQCKDLSRMYYIPADYAKGYNFIFSGNTDPIDVNDLLSRYPYVEKVKTGNSFIERLPPELAQAVVEHRKSMMQNTNIHWTGYRDCPFWPKKLAAEYVTISNTGWYHKMYQMMVAIAARALEKEYPITSHQIAELCKQFDAENGNWYENRPLNLEADRALEYAYRNV
ncbi:hypothetical protein N9B98_03360, partial [bacterium]|nr:hypothetical protein [bacterium]